MNKHNGNRPKSFKLHFVILFSLFLLASCNKGNVEKPENICTLTAEQIPEVRGFRLGMSADAVKQRFPSICPAKSISPYDLEKAKIPVKYDSTLGLTVYKASTNNSSNFANNCEYVNTEAYPELEGVASVNLGFEKGIVERIYIEYDKTTDEFFPGLFRYETKKLIGINDFTNSDFISNVLAANRKEYELDGSQTLCNKVLIQIGTKKFVNVSPSYYTPFLQIEKSLETAKTKAQTEQEKNDAENQKQADDQKKRETFKP